jgi:hypothetical protein
MSTRRLGQPVADCDPIALEVHPAITVPGQQYGASEQPAVGDGYHVDRVVRQVLVGSEGCAQRRCR